MKKLVVVLIALSIIPIGIFLYAWNNLHEQINGHIYEDLSNIALAKTAKTYYLTKSDGDKLAYWYFPVKKPKAVIILIHGYGNPGGKGQMADHIEYLQAAGYSTVIPDLRSFGQSDGNKTTFGVTEWQDISQLYDYIKSLPENKDKKIGFMGVSMGATTAIVAAGQTGKGDFIIASVPFVDFRSLFGFRLSDTKYASIIYPFVRLAGHLELGLNYRRFTPIELIGKVNVPILIFSAARDEYVSSADAGKLFQMANDPKKYWQADSGHDIFAAHPDQFKQHVLDFLKSSI